ncbi:MAG: LysR family transcriptional regulator [Rhodobacteraceae bacterium]|nr:LysR family transcriptional regulator [Paracoccaceae bacterium]
MRNLDLTTLRSFVAVADSGGVTRAAGFLNLTQSAVSMQLKRLEELLGLELLERSGRGVALTASGQQLLNYARRMVDLNDEIYAKLTREEWEGEVVLGVPHDIVYPVIPRVMKRMQRDYPRVKVQLISSYTRDLKERFRKGEVDVILTTEAAASEGGEVLIEVPLQWYGAKDSQVWKSKPLRVAFCTNCAFSPIALNCLNKASYEWTTAVSAESDRAIEVSVSADLAVTAVLEGHEPPQYELIPLSAGLPDLGTQQIVLYQGAVQQNITAPLAAFIESEFSALRNGRIETVAA